MPYGASNLLQQRLMRLSHVDNNLRVVLAKIVRAMLILIGVLVALSFVGIDLTVLSVFGGALGVGIGLGLQKLASNYIAGFTILLDRSIRVGDMITVDSRIGAVSQVTSRYVVVRSLDGVEAIVPNETLVTTTVLNHSYTSKDIKVGVPVQISIRQRPRTRDAADCARSAETQDRVLMRARHCADRQYPAFRRHRHRARAGRLDQRSGERPGELEIGALTCASGKRSASTASRSRSPQRDIRIVGAPPADEASPAPK